MAGLRPLVVILSAKLPNEIQRGDSMPCTVGLWFGMNLSIRSSVGHTKPSHSKLVAR